MIEGISSVYGAPLPRSSRIAGPAASHLETESGSVMARWADTQHRVVLYQTFLRRGVTMRRGSGTGIAEVWARYPTIAAARLGITKLLRDDRILRVMIVRNEIPPPFVEWVER